MKILSAKQIRETDQYTIEHEPIRSIDLMERASKAFVNWFIHAYEKSRRVIVFCGTGNNGGDGLVISRLLKKQDWDVITYTVKGSSRRSPDFQINFQRLSEISEISDLNSKDDLNIDFHTDDILIDAIFGSGLKKNIEGYYAKVIQYLNGTGCSIVAVDVPSGLYCDEHSSGESIIKSESTLSFQLPKLAFVLPENVEYVKHWYIADIGLDEDYIQKKATDYYFLERDIAAGLLKTRDKFSHKTQFGKIILIAGSYGKIGASILCARACLRIGAGLVTVHTPECGNLPLQTSVPEAMVSIDVNERFISSCPDLEKFDIAGVGPGIDQHLDTMYVLENVLKNSENPIVLDADALNIIAQHKVFLKNLPTGSILTPHPGEFRRMVGNWANDFERLELQRKLSMDYGVFVVLKGYHTSISSPEGKVYFNSTGNPGMATGGSGDVLTGMLTGLLGQGYSAESAALLGVYLHGLAGDLAAEKLGEEALIASDIIDFIPNAYMDLRGNQ
jgi:NAD(P)H-hydrate epimerase